MEYKKIKKELLQNQKTWLITGVAGFIGSNLAEELLKLNQKVISIDNFSTGYKYNLDEIKRALSRKQFENFTFVKGDIANYDICKLVTKNVDIILHQAALGSVPKSIDNPIISNNSNVTGFLNILSAAKDSGIKRFIYASSSSVYGNSTEMPKVEERIGDFLSPYAVTKYVNELYANIFHKCYDMETIGLRYFNVFGKRQDPDGAYAAVIPKWINHLLKREELYINGDGTTSRDFVYIDDVVQANILAGMTKNKDSFGQVFNTGVGDKKSLNNLYEIIIVALKKHYPNMIVKDPIYREFRAGDIKDSNANIDKIKEVLLFKPTHTLKEGIKESIAWYIDNIIKT